MRRHPHLYEVNARIFLRRMSERYGRKLTIASIPDEVWIQLKAQGFDLLWLMGAWRRSPGARLAALNDPSLRRAFDEALPDWTERDVIGSPYAIYDYSLDPALGERWELAELKKKLNKIGLKLILDFVPNHLAFDHPWTSEHPERFVHGNKHLAKQHPGWFFAAPNGIYLAHGRDPNFPPWRDTVQVNFFSEDFRSAWAEQMLLISESCDGLRCDMAMFGLTRVFEEIWGEFLRGDSRPEEEFWTMAIRKLKVKRPEFILLAEVYWDLEWKLQELGFDFTYDKPLYDRLRFFTSPVVREHLKALPGYQSHSARFIENHDELRAPVAFDRERSLAAAVIMSTVPGLRFFHDGQLEGRSVRLPIQLKREPAEEPNPKITAFYTRLLAIINRPFFHEGEWKLLDIKCAWEGNESDRNLLAWVWTMTDQIKLVIVNYASGVSQGKLFIPLPSATTAALSPTTTTSVVFEDELTGQRYTRNTKELEANGLYIELGPWKSHMLSVI